MTAENQASIETLRVAKAMLVNSIANQGDDLLLLSEGTYDESMLFGSRASYLRLAIWCLEFVCDVEEGRNDMVTRANPAPTAKEIVAYTNNIKHFFNEVGDVWPVVAYMCRGKPDRERLLGELNKSGGEV